MRNAALTAALAWTILLGACAAPAPSYTPHFAGDVGAAAYCEALGFRSGSYDFESCYKNRPEIQAFDRTQRLESMQIIVANRSPRCLPGLSVPVE